MDEQPTAIGRYVIKEALGRGRWGIVYRAHDPELDRFVALKYIPLADEAQRRRCRREARVAANLSHPHIVPVYDATQTDDATYIVMELLTGGTLRQYLSTPLAWQRGVSLLLPLCDALAYAHEQGFIHRDAKPENILFSASGEIKLADFGLAYLVGASRLTRGSGMVGTPCYAAPEQIRSEPVDGRADVFALAAVLYEVLTGRLIFKGDDYQVIHQVTQDEPVDLSSLQKIVPPSILKSLARALDKDPLKRYTADEFGAALRRCLESATGSNDVCEPFGLNLRTKLQLNDAPSLQRPIRLDWPEGVPHTSEEDELLRRLYEDEPPRQSHPDVVDRSIGRVLVREELPGGFGGARVLVVIPVERNEAYQAARVVKLGPRVMLEAERDNYDNFVREHLPTAIASRKRFAVRGTMAAIEYVFVGGGLLEPVRDLITCYREHSSRETAKTLRALLSDHLGQYWYRQGRMLQEFTAAEYGPHLPAQVSLELRPGSDDWLGSESEPMPQGTEGYRPLDVNDLLHDRDPAAPGEAVQVQGLEVLRIKPWAATLTHRRERQVRVRVEYEQESGVAQQLQIGQHIAVRGQVVATRHGLLGSVVRAAFDDKISLDDDQVLAGLPNPLKLYPVLLNEMLEGRCSVIHGDLHLRNVLVDRDGRPWLIDFGRVRQGHTLFDFIKLETYIRLDVLSEASGFTLDEYVQFEQALAAATCYGLWAARLPTNRELLKAFRVIWAIRRLAGRFHGQDELAEIYFRCLLLYNLAVLKYAREAVLVPGGKAEERDRQLQAARLCFIAAAVQGHWIKNPPRPWWRPRGMLEGWRESSLADRLTGLATPAFYLFIAVFLVTLLGLGYSAYHSRRQARQARAESLNSQGAIYMGQGDPGAAVELFQQAIQADPEYPTAHHNLGMAYYVQGDLERAAVQFQKAIDLDPSYASPHYALGRVYDDQGRTEDALGELGRAIELDPSMSEAYSEIGYILNRQELYAEAVTVLQEGLEKGQERSPPYLLKNLGRAYLGLGDPAQAVKHLEIAAARLSRDDALYIETHRLLAEAYEAQGDLDKALQEWQGPLRDEPDAPENIQRLSQPAGETG